MTCGQRNMRLNHPQKQHIPVRKSSLANDESKMAAFPLPYVEVLTRFTNKKSKINYVMLEKT